MHSRSLLRIRWDDVLRNGVLDVALDKGVQVRREDACKMVGYIGAKKELLNLSRKTLDAACQKRYISEYGLEHTF